MRVSIRHRERTRGFLRPVRQIEVSLSVRFSETERAVIRRRQLEDFIVLKRQPDALTVRRLSLLGIAPDGRDLLVANLLSRRPNRFLCDTPAHAKSYERSLAEGLRILKSFSLGNESVGPGRVFDL